MVGSAVWRALEARGYSDLIGKTSQELDLRDQQAEQAEDWVIATGETTTVRDFVRMAFAEVGIELEFKGKGINEKAYVVYCQDPNYQLEIGKEVLSVDPTYFRPTEVDLLIGDPSKAKNKLGWVPEHDLASLVMDMMQSDLKLFKNEH